MDNFFVNTIIEPKELFLMWKDSEGSRHQIGVLEENLFTYLPKEGDEMKKAIAAGFQGFPAFDMQKAEHRNPLPVFMRRCPPKERRDFDEYLKAFSLNPESPEVQNMSDFALLGYTGAYVPNNPFNLINPFSNQNKAFEFVMQIAGAHHWYFAKNSKEGIEGKNLQAIKEPENTKDHNAVFLKLDDHKFGYIQRGLNTSFASWIDDDRIESIKISRVNGRADHPYAYAFVKISSLK